MSVKLHEIILSLTNRCNLRCTMCQIPENGNEEELGTEDVKTLIRDSLKLQPQGIVFSGGEPLLRNDIFELIAFAHSHEIKTCLTSNGTLIDERAARRLSGAGIDVVNISIEGPESIHDGLRGGGNFKKAMAALSALARYRIETTIATLICRQNYVGLPYVLELAHQRRISTVKFQPFSEIFLKDRDRQKDFFIPEDALTQVRRVISKVILLSKEYEIATNPPDYLLSLSSYLCGSRRRYPRQRCLALWTSCPISANGDVHLCWVLPDKVLGNIRKNGLSKIWNSDEHNRLRRRPVKQGCGGCLMSCYDRNFEKRGLGRLAPGYILKRLLKIF